MEYIFRKAKNTEIKCSSKAGILPTTVVPKVAQILPELEKAMLYLENVPANLMLLC